MRTSALYIFLSAILAFQSCENKSSDEGDVKVIRGEAQGTTYSVKYHGENEVTKTEIDSILREIDLSLSAWVEESVLNSFNLKDSLKINDSHFINVFYRSKEIAELTDGAFHPMVMPLVRAWGFGVGGGELREDANLDSLKQLVNFNFEVEAIPNQNAVRIIKGGQKMDVNGIAQGYSVDVVVSYLEKQGVENYMVEIGGEVLTSGESDKGEAWRIGVDKPLFGADQRELEAVISLNDAALATSGSYRKFYEKDGQRYSHTIDPSTGRPVEHNLLSATVRSSNCTDADALATAFMVMGTEKAKEFLSKNPQLNLDVFLIYDENGELKTFMTEGFSKDLEEV